MIETLTDLEMLLGEARDWIDRGNPSMARDRIIVALTLLPDIEEEIKKTYESGFDDGLQEPGKPFWI